MMVMTGLHYVGVQYPRYKLVSSRYGQKYWADNVFLSFLSAGAQMKLTRDVHNIGKEDMMKSGIDSEARCSTGRRVCSHTIDRQFA